MAFYTPLRYPGGKRRLATVIMRLLDANGLKDIHYAEPYAGGAAVALALTRWKNTHPSFTSTILADLFMLSGTRC